MILVTRPRLWQSGINESATAWNCGCAGSAGIEFWYLPSAALGRTGSLRYTSGKCATAPASNISDDGSDPPVEMPGLRTVEALTCRSLATYYILFFIHLETRRITLAAITRHHTGA